MTMKNRSNASKKLHADSLISLGNYMQKTMVVSAFIAPLLLMIKQLFNNTDHISKLSHLEILNENYDSAFTLLVLIAIMAAIGTYFKSKGFDLIDEIENT
ncbi:hypothetical protein [Motiliproteus sp.]|uniref:hypothetical protein n=1 Tax=Motiliproteus sp. TaxID=1898955 RepID=UPI003BA95A4C